MIKLFFVNNWLHQKNKDALFKYKNIEIVTNINYIEDCDVIYSPYDVFSYNGNKKIIYGPHFSVYPDHRLDIITKQNYIYVQPSEWVINDFWKKHFNICKDLKMMPLPFGVDTEKFKPEQLEKTNVFLYYKRRHPNELEYIEKFLNTNNIKYRLFKYGHYNEQEYLEYLNTCKYGIWLDAHESQGFALEEALSMNVPLLVWNIKYMSQEYGSNYQNYEATTIPYWSEECGEYFYEQHEFEDKFNLFISKIDKYEPRKFILENLSIDKCEEKLINLIKSF
jgi:glycosyltransferase involved in cell wall biosynthesis